MTSETLSTDVNGVAARLGSSRATIWKLISNGQLKSFRIGKKRFVSEQELQRFIKAQEEEIAHEAAGRDLVCG